MLCRNMQETDVIFILMAFANFMELVMSRLNADIAIILEKVLD